MEHKRQRVQFGWVSLKARKKGPDVWFCAIGKIFRTGVQLGEA
jgi:hypothetical protein